VKVEENSGIRGRGRLRIEDGEVKWKGEDIGDQRKVEDGG
jgi:hypothetical protein